ncbi:hypothetical protein F4802DRAFT_602996 [Xylaria palmicola]|nr:hypothetical protein F4802DRAFT_602996 [Xylaria palmicola]
MTICRIARLMVNSELIDSEDPMSIKSGGQQGRQATFGDGIPLRLDVGVLGLLSNLHFIEDYVGGSAGLKPYEIEIPHHERRRRPPRRLDRPGAG